MSIRRLRPPSQYDTVPNEVRRRRQAVIRCVYFTSLALLAVWLGNLCFGDYLYLRSDGQVMAEPAIVAVEFPATVRSLPVHEGDGVSAGQPVAIISSQSVSETLARLTAEQADRTLRLGDARVRAATINAVIGLAQTREAVASDSRQKLETLLPGGFLANDRHTQALDIEFRSREDLARLTAERGALTQQIQDLSRAVSEADSAIATLRKLYDGGVLRSPIDGIVGRRLADDGSVIGPDKPILEIYHRKRFVLAFLPPGRLFSLGAGDQVTITTGLQSFTGTIDRIDPVARALPPEFQRAFAPVERQQVLRIAFNPGETPPPLFTKVSIRSRGILSHLIGWL